MAAAQEIPGLLPWTMRFSARRAQMPLDSIHRIDLIDSDSQNRHYDIMEKRHD